LPTVQFKSHPLKDSDSKSQTSQQYLAIFKNDKVTGSKEV